ncbi:MAG TPA: metallopeptidase TldD-related protein, partial [Fibrobacteria bacterium]|nr:metallopeptidase TldD-related protein [Fibrobacteria bacterium]
AIHSSEVIKAMASELRRSMDSLWIKGGPKPYFLSYLIWDVHSYRMQASLGSCDLSAFEDQHLLDIDLRVGDYRRDNTNFQGSIVFGPRLRLPMPQENDTNLIRLSLWAATDAKYKVALEQLAQKRAFLENQAGRDTLADFSRGEVGRLFQADSQTPPDTAKVVALGKTLSAHLARYPWLAESRVGYQYYYTTFYYVDSEGTRYIQTVKEHTLLVSLFTQAKDGAPLWDYLRIATRDPLPVGEREGPTSLETLKRAVDSLARRLDFLRKSDPLTGYRGPVLFAGAAAGELLNKALLAPQSRLREPMGLGAEPNFLIGLKGLKYFPSGITITDRPSVKAHEGRALFGHYGFDHQGQPARDIVLVEDGRIKDYLLGKVPVFREREHKGNGHFRYGGGFPGVTSLTSATPMPEKELRSRVAALGGEEGLGYGLVVGKPFDEDAFKLLRHPLAIQLVLGEAGDGRGTFALSIPCEVDIVDARSGKVTPARGLSFPAIDSKSLRDIVAVGDHPHLHEPQASFSILCPSLLFSLLDLKGERATQPRLPYLP